MIDWNDLRHFLAFARSGSAAAAAEILGVNQSTVQRRLSELERRLGGKLIKRHRSGYTLTDLGEEAVPLATQVETAVMAFERYLAARYTDLTGTIRVTCSPTVGERLKRSALVDTFQQRFPGLTVELLLTDRFVDLSKGEADIGIRSQGRELEDETLVARKIAEQTWAIWASRSYISRHGRPHNREDLARHRLIGCNGTIANHFAATWLRNLAPNATITTYTDSWPGLASAVKSGAGLAALSVAHGSSEGDLVRVLDIPELITRVYLVMHRDMQRAPRVRAFFDFVISELQSFRELLSGASGRSKPSV
jgi:DNA-binding transcriptional LysR family regulator